MQKADERRWRINRRRLAVSRFCRVKRRPAEAETRMPYKVNETRRHKIPRARYRVEN